LVTLTVRITEDAGTPAGAADNTQLRTTQTPNRHGDTTRDGVDTEPALDKCYPFAGC